MINLKSIINTKELVATMQTKRAISKYLIVFGYFSLNQSSRKRLKKAGMVIKIATNVIEII
jgi:hypothetical protein